MTLFMVSGCPERDVRTSGSALGNLIVPLRRVVRATASKSCLVGYAPLSPPYGLLSGPCPVSAWKSSVSKSHWIPAQVHCRNDESGGSGCFSRQDAPRLPLGQAALDLFFASAPSTSTSRSENNTSDGSSGVCLPNRVISMIRHAMTKFIAMDRVSSPKCPRRPLCRPPVHKDATLSLFVEPDKRTNMLRIITKPFGRVDAQFSANQLERQRR